MHIFVKIEQGPRLPPTYGEKWYPREFTSDTITGSDGYPLYLRRSPDDNGRTTTITIRNQNITVDNRWVVPYSPLLPKIFEAHINVEY